jgi:hypothetical protein
MTFEKHELVYARFTPLNELVYLPVARAHIGKTFKWMFFKDIEIVKGKSMPYFTPHDRGFEHIPATPISDLSELKRILED